MPRSTQKCQSRIVANQWTNCLTTLFPFPSANCKLQFITTKQVTRLSRIKRGGSQLKGTWEKDVKKCSQFGGRETCTGFLLSMSTSCNTQYICSCYANMSKSQGNVLCINKHPPPRKQPFTGCLLGRVKWFSTYRKYD